MKLQIKLEDDDTNIEINVDPAEGMDDEIADQEAAEDLEVADVEVEAALTMGRRVVDVIENLTSLRAHFKKFGVTKQSLHLVNGNGQLSAALGITLPYYEEDEATGELVEDIDIDDVPPEEVLMESFGSGIDKAVEAIKTFFKKLYASISNWLGAVFTSAGRLNSSLKKASAKAVAVKHTTGTAAWETKKLKVMSPSDIQTNGEAMNAAIQGLYKVSVTSAGVVVPNLDRINEGLAFVGKALKEKSTDGDVEGVTIEAAGSAAAGAPKEATTLKAAGWTAATISAVNKKAGVWIKTILEGRTMEKTLKKTESEIISGLKKDKEDTKGLRTGTTTTTGAIISGWKALINTLMNYIRMFITVCNVMASNSGEAKAEK